MPTANDQEPLTTNLSSQEPLTTSLSSQEPLPTTTNPQQSPCFQPDNDLSKPGGHYQIQTNAALITQCISFLEDKIAKETQLCAVYKKLDSIYCHQYSIQNFTKENYEESQKTLCYFNQEREKLFKLLSELNLSLPLLAADNQDSGSSSSKESSGFNLNCSNGSIFSSTLGYYKKNSPLSTKKIKFYYESLLAQSKIASSEQYRDSAIVTFDAPKIKLINTAIKKYKDLLLVENLFHLSEHEEIPSEKVKIYGTLELHFLELTSQQLLLNNNNSAFGRQSLSKIKTPTLSFEIFLDQVLVSTLGVRATLNKIQSPLQESCSQVLNSLSSHAVLEESQHPPTPSGSLAKWSLTEKVTLNLDMNSTLTIFVNDACGNPCGFISLALVDVVNDSQTLPELTSGNIRGATNVLELQPLGSLSVAFVYNSNKLVQLRRQNCIRKKTYSYLEHDFIFLRSFKLLKCSTCYNFIFNGTFKCKTCGYVCHKACLKKCVSPCGASHQAKLLIISKLIPDLRFQINNPHHFEKGFPFLPSFCIHCGHNNANYICQNCGVYGHLNCCKYIANYCSISANILKLLRLSIEKGQQQQQQQQLMGAILSPSRLTSPSVLSRQQTLRSLEPRPSLKIKKFIKTLPSVKFSRAEHLKSNKSSHSGVRKPGSQDSLFVQTVPFLSSKRSSSSETSATTTCSSLFYTSKEAKGTKTRKYIPSDFIFLNLLGKGNFGQVHLAKDTKTNTLVALKTIKKSTLLEKNELESVISEKNVFIRANKSRHPFLVELHACFEYGSRIYFVMEYIAGGDLMWHIQRVPFSNFQIKLYSAEILLALEYLHKNNIIYRDLKLDNILLAKDGHVKLADYGLCKERMGFSSTTSTFCGTPEFMAPEIIKGLFYTRAIDWWGYGILLYEMHVGKSPFRGDTEEAVFEQILYSCVEYPLDMDPNVQNLLEKLLVHEPRKRLGYYFKDIQKIKSHPYFSDLNFNDVFKKKTSSPYKPALNSEADTSHFEEEFTRSKSFLPSPLESSDKQDTRFENFNYTAPWIFSTEEQTNEA